MNERKGINPLTQIAVELNNKVHQKLEETQHFPLQK
jgi:hypothetical protein